MQVRAGVDSVAPSPAPRFDSVIHPEQRLRICAFLLPAEQVVFGAIRDALGHSDSALSKHLRTLAEAGYIATTKEGAVPRPRTWVALTTAGRNATRAHLAALQALATADGPGADGAA